MADTLTLDAPRRTKDGYLVVRARTARVGVQDYLGYEVDPDGKRFKAMDRVPVYRPAEEVFAADAVASFFGKPITNDHPTVAVTADNWRQHARGFSAGALKDGDYLAFDLALMDAETVAAVDAGKRELSAGYSCTLEFGDGVAPDGTPYKATQRRVRGNHIAVVDRGRAGSECRIGDAAPCESLLSKLLDQSGDLTVKKIVLDGLTVDLGDADAVAAAINKLSGKLTDAETQVGKLTTDLATANTSLQTKDGEIAALKAQLADAQDPAKLQAAAAARAKLVGDAKKLVPTLVTDSKSDAEIKRAAVVAKLGDAAKDMADAAIDGAFLALVPTADTKPDPIRKAVMDAAPLSDLASIRDAARVASLN